MGKIKPFSLARIAVSLLCGFIAALATISCTWMDLRGDDPGTIKEVSTIVGPFAVSHKGYMIVELEPAEWSKVKAAAARLSYPNREIARAKVFAVITKPPEPNMDAEWQLRFERAAMSYLECTRTKRALVSLGYGALKFVQVGAAAWILFLGASWIWYFSLDRVRELSTALRAMRDEDAG